MPLKKPAYIDVDKLAAQPDAAQRVLRHFGIRDDEIQNSGDNLRTRCFLECGHCQPTGDRVLSIQHTHAAKLYHCHRYGCDKEGNLVSLVSLAIGGPVRPRGEDFKRVRALLQEILVEGAPSTHDSPPPHPLPSAEIPAETEAKSSAESHVATNTPLTQHPNERVRGIADLWRKVTLDEGAMSPAASLYKRHRPFLNDKMAAEFHFGWLPKGTEGDRAGGTMRSKFLYEIRNSEGLAVAYAGRDVEWEKKLQQWRREGSAGNAPEKYRLPRGFVRGCELFGADRLQQHHLTDRVREKLRRIGLPVVEGFNDVIALWHDHRMRAVGLMSNQATKQQIELIAKLAHEVAGGVVTLLLDCDAEGDRGADHMTVPLSKHCRVQRGWAVGMYGGRFDGRQPEEIQRADAEFLAQHLVLSP